MKKIVNLFLVSSIFFSGLANASSLSCSGYTTIPGNFISGTCYSGSCSASVYSGSISAQGSCLGSVQFNANAFLPSQFISGQCRGGQFSANISGASISWNGYCSNRGSFYASPSYMPSSYIYGSCSENGSFSAQTSPISITVNAQCGANQ